MRKRVFVCLLAVLAAFAGTAAWAGDFLAVFSSQPSNSDVITVTETYDALSGEGKFFALISSTKTLEELRALPEVLGVSASRQYKALSITPNDPKFSSLWGIPAVKAPEVWEYTIGYSDVYVAVIDSGVDYSHSDLADNFEKDGYSISYYGGSDNYSDGVGHGTHVAGTIAAVGDNSEGVVGINWNAKIISVRILNNRGECSSIELIKALDHIAGLLKDNPSLNLAAVNLSIGGYGSDSPSEMIAKNDPEYLAFLAVSELNRTILCVAAGDDGVEVGTNTAKGYCYPASFTGIDNMIVVAAADNSSTGDYTLASYSNYSKTYVDLAAPGTGIYSTNSGGGFSMRDGTSMATPHVAGAVALLKSAFPDATASEIKSALLRGANHDLFKNSTANGFMNVKAAYDGLNVNVHTAPTIKTSTLDDGKLMTEYNARIFAIGSSPMTWSIVDGELPDGFTFTSQGSYSTITGSTDKVGDYSITVEAKNSLGTASKKFDFKIIKVPVITSTTLPALDRGKDYSAQLEVAGTESKPIWRLVNGSSLPGTLMMTDSGLITGTVNSSGTYTFDVAASSSNGYDIKTITLVCGVIPSIYDIDVPAGKVGEYYTLTFSGRSSKATWSIKGNLPKGLIFDADWSYIYGTPTEAGKFDLTVFLTSNVGEDKRNITIEIADEAPVIATTTLPQGVVGVAYSQELALSAGTNVTWSKTAGTLPAGLTLKTDGTITGEPTTAGTYNFTVQAKNTVGTVTKDLSITVAGGSVTPSGGNGGNEGSNSGGSKPSGGNGGSEGGNSGGSNTPSGGNGGSEGGGSNKPSGGNGGSEGGNSGGSKTPSGGNGGSEGGNSGGGNTPSDGNGGSEGGDSGGSNTPSGGNGGSNDNGEGTPEAPDVPSKPESEDEPAGLNLENPASNDATPNQFETLETIPGSSSGADPVEAGAYKEPLEEASLDDTKVNSAVSGKWPGATFRSVSNDMDQSDDRGTSDKSLVARNAVESEQARLGTGEKIVYAYVLPLMRPKKTGIFTFALPLAPDMVTGHRLIWSVSRSVRTRGTGAFQTAGVSLAADDTTAVFIDTTTGKEITDVPESRAVTVSTYLDENYDYEPVVLTETDKDEDKSPTSNKGSGGCNAGLGLVGLLALVGLIATRKH